MQGRLRFLCHKADPCKLCEAGEFGGGHAHVNVLHAFANISEQHLHHLNLNIHILPAHYRAHYTVTLCAEALRMQRMWRRLFQAQWDQDTQQVCAFESARDVHYSVSKKICPALVQNMTQPLMKRP